LRFLVTSLGSYGDVYPLIGIARALAARGHDVFMLTNDRYAGAVEDADLTFVSPGQGDTVSQVLGKFDVKKANKSAPLLMNKMMLAPLRPVYRQLEELCIPGETVVVSFPMVLAARLVAERLSIPQVMVSLAPAGFRSLEAPPQLFRFDLLSRLPKWAIRLVYFLTDVTMDWFMLREVNRFRGELQMKPIRWVWKWMESSDAILALYPPWFAPPPADLPSQAALSDFPLFDAKESQALPPELEEFLATGPPPVVFTIGSPAGGADWFHRESARACTALGCRGVLLTQYPDDVPDELPEGVIHLPYAPFSELLPRAAAFVHHGGIGTCSQALKAGVPQLVTPWGVDQFDNLRWLKKLGVAMEQRLSSYTGEVVAENLRQLLAAPEMAGRCTEVAGRFDGEGLATICAHLEAFAEDHLG